MLVFPYQGPAESDSWSFLDNLSVYQGGETEVCAAASMISTQRRSSVEALVRKITQGQ